jgi:hypothetical protein
MAAIKRFLKRFIEKHIIADFPYPPQCFDCKRGDCEGCPLR